MKNSKNLNMNIFAQLTQIFNENFERLPENVRENLFNRVSKLLDSLNKDEQKIVMELFKNVEYYSILDYETLLIEVIRQIQEDTSIKNIMFTPMISQRYQREVKSSMLVTYLFKSNVIKYEFPNFKFKASYKIDITDAEITNINSNKDKRLAIVDDFIGTGHSASEAADYFIGKGLSKDKIIIVSLLTLTQGEEFLANKNFNFFYARKSLTLKEHNNHLSEDEKNRLYININEISEKVGAPSRKRHLGFGDSQALVSMIRVPNNSLHMLWNGSDKEAIPFPRIK